MAVASTGPYANSQHSGQITTSTPHHSIFVGLTPNQQRQSTEGNRKKFMHSLAAFVVIANDSFN